MKDINNVEAQIQELGIDKLEGLIRDIRNSRRIIAATVSGQKDTESKVEKAKSELQAALDTADLEKITKSTDDLKRGMRKLAEDPDEKILNFKKAVNALIDFASDLGESEWMN